MTQFYAVDVTQSVFPFNVYMETLKEPLSVITAFNPLYAQLVQTVLKNSTSLVDTGVFNYTVTALAKAREGSVVGGSLYWEDLLQKAVAAGTVSFIPVVLVSETIYGTDFYADTLTRVINSTETITLGGVLLGIYTRAVTETIRHPSAVVSIPVWVMQETATLTGSLNSKAVLNGIVNVRLTIAEAVIKSLMQYISETVTVSAGVSAFVKKLLQIRDTILAKGLAETLFEATTLLHESIRLSIITGSGKGAAVTEQVLLHAAYSTLFGFAGNAASSMVLSAAVQPSLSFLITAADSITVIDPASGAGGFDPLQFLGLLINEQVNVKIGYNANNGNWTGWALNTQVSAVTQYGQWAFNSFGAINGVDIAASNQGLFTLGGSTDNNVPISAQITLGTSDFGDSRLKRVQYAYIGINSEGALFFITNTDDGVERIYSLVADAPYPHTERITMARGVASRYWSFSLQNIAGADFRVDDIEVIPVMLSRRV